MSLPTDRQQLVPSPTAPPHAYRAAYTQYQRLRLARSNQPFRHEVLHPEGSKAFCSISSCGTRAAFIRRSGKIHIFSVDGAELLRVRCQLYPFHITGHAKPPAVLSWGMGASRDLIAIGDSRAVRVISAATGNVVGELSAPKDAYVTLCWDQRGLRLAVATAHSLAVCTGLPYAFVEQCRARIDAGPQFSSSTDNFCFSSDSSMVLCCSSEATVYSTRDCTQLYESSCKQEGVGFLGSAWDPSSSLLALLVTCTVSEQYDPPSSLEDLSFDFDIPVMSFENSATPRVVLIETQTWTQTLSFVRSGHSVHEAEFDFLSCNFQWSPSPLVHCLSFFDSEGQVQLLFPGTGQWRTFDVDLDQAKSGMLKWSPDGWFLATVDMTSVVVVDTIRQLEITSIDMQPEIFNDEFGLDGDEADGASEEWDDACIDAVQWCDAGLCLAMIVGDGPLAAYVLEF